MIVCARFRGVGLVQLLHQSGSRRKTCPACEHGRNGSVPVPGEVPKVAGGPEGCRRELIGEGRDECGRPCTEGSAEGAGGQLNGCSAQCGPM